MLFRSQFELLAIRESADIIADAGFIPIVEPVRETFKGLQRTLQELQRYGAATGVITNPRHGDHRHDGEGIAAYLSGTYGDNDAVLPAVLLTSVMTTDDAMEKISRYSDRPLMLVHAGFSDGKGLGAQVLQHTQLTHVFLDARNTLYRRHFQSGVRVLVEDGFEKKKNADYGLVPVDRFSDLHITYSELGGDA